MTVRRRGGTVVDGPLQMRTADDAYTDGEPERGAEVVLFLGYDANQKIFYSCGGPFGVFVVREGNVEAISKEVGARRADVPMPVSQFLADLTDKLLKAK